MLRTIILNTDDGIVFSAIRSFLETA